MNKKAALLLVIIFPLMSFSCSSLGRPESGNNRSDVPDISNEKPVMLLPEGWQYETVITHEGSRSEGSVSRLFYRYNEIPGVFKRIIIEQNIFEYRVMKNLWDNCGYILSESTAVDVSAIDDSLDSFELKRGWYETSGGKSKKATPPDWILVETDEYSLMVSPDRINDLIAFYDLKPAGIELLQGPVDE